GGEIYNVGGGNEMTNLEVTTTILRELQKPKELIRFVRDRPGHDRRYSLDCAKISQLGFKPRHRFSEAIRATIEWYVHNCEWWQKRKSGDYWAYYERVYGGALKGDAS
ncbi:MAG: dTDP-glucose 4,6-dehydratase, partial [Candidatus Binatia bacterium]